MAGAGRAEQTRELTTGLPTRLTGSERTALLVEDVPWLGSASWKLLGELTRRAHVSVCLVTRPLRAEDQPTEAHRFLDRARIGQLEIAERGARVAGHQGVLEALPPGALGLELGTQQGRAGAADL